jgi:hypothetical protein
MFRLAGCPNRGLQCKLGIGGVRHSTVSWTVRSRGCGCLHALVFLNKHLFVRWSLKTSLYQDRLPDLQSTLVEMIDDVAVGIELRLE